MKLVKAYLRYRKTEDVFRALRAAGHCCVTLVDCEGTGNYVDQEKEHISEKYPFINAARVIKLELLVPENKVKEVIRLIRKHGRTGYRGDGMILVSPVDNVYKVRTDEVGIRSI